MSSRTQAYCTNYCTNAVDTPRYMATFSDTTIKKDPRFLGSSWLLNDGCWWRWGGVELSAACSSAFVVVRRCRDNPHFYHSSCCQRPSAFAGTGVKTGVRADCRFALADQCAS